MMLDQMTPSEYVERMAHDQLRAERANPESSRMISVDDPKFADKFLGRD